MNLEQKKFEEWKRRHGKLDEGFLDGNDDLETADVPSEGVSSEEEKDLSEEPSEDDVEGGDEQPETDSTEGDAPEEGDASEEGGDNSGENMDDFGEGEDEAETQTDDGVEKEAEDTTELKDVLTTLTTAVQALTDKIDTMNAETGEEGGEEAPAEGGDDAAMDDFGSVEGGEEAPAEETSEGGDEGGEGESAKSGESEGSEGGEGESKEGGEGESSEEAPADETKSENFNFYHKKGQPLDEDSDYVIGKLYEDRFDKLEPFILTALKMKIRNHIEEYKKQVRMDAISKKLEK